MKPSDGKRPRYLTTIPTYSEFALTYKWCHVHKLCSCYGLSSHLVPICPLHNIFITENIRAISHTDLNPEVPCRDEVFDGEICIFETSPLQCLSLLVTRSKSQ
eukprot:TRINITY_DN7278_c0_g1_i1.p1 TRINITY_DN7278_c0_g1~~TRINITY_DN7278_c0_g1_i1.p1  ORF type:complete len:103 (-),score=5.88 TRINITY_DN7278_c0_g1_i1:500-808(-)